MAPPNTTSDSSSSDDVNQYIVRPVVEVSDEEASSEEQEEVQHSQPSFKNPKPIASTHSKSGSDSEPKTSGKKRVVNDNNAKATTSKPSKRSKKKKEAVTAAAGEENNDVRLTGGRVFSEEEDLVILQGITDFISENGKDPFKHSAAFHSFIKDSIRPEISTQQIKRKLRGFKEDFEKGKWKYDDDKETFELFRKIGWGDNNGNEAEKGKGKVAYMSLCMNKEAAEKGLELIGDSKRAELTAKWRNYHIAAMEALVDRAEFVKYIASLILKELQKSTY